MAEEADKTKKTREEWKQRTILLSGLVTGPDERSGSETW